MNNTPPVNRGDAIHVEGLKVWARVGVLPEERSLGQWFVVDFTIWLDLAPAGRSDDLSLTVDYGQAVAAIRACGEQVVCHTVECFSEQLLDQVEAVHGACPVRLILRKCHPPIPGFDGSISVERWRFAG
ncbi:MAG: dihydroneopterin aldolase [Cyanobacteria bacterium MAG CAR3_bin_5]|nr:dihydroneopterin aldolase [Cyanobacteria bacterium MAG CAR4_bin_6]MCY4173623.1 dihydroneopterin aldolase [Cyanobacteria bacterium MAG CAR3_bin_5]MCY4235208.1 dihydroneopterin aldolase [Cyanobacteria bacterium MAG CAR2_bin_4]